MAQMLQYSVMPSSRFVFIFGSPAIWLCHIMVIEFNYCYINSCMHLLAPLKRFCCCARSVICRGLLQCIFSAFLQRLISSCGAASRYFFNHICEFIHLFPLWCKFSRDVLPNLWCFVLPAVPCPECPHRKKQNAKFWWSSLFSVETWTQSNLTGTWTSSSCWSAGNFFQIHLDHMTWVGSSHSSLCLTS